MDDNKNKISIEDSAKEEASSKEACTSWTIDMSITNDLKIEETAVKVPSTSSPKCGWFFVNLDAVEKPVPKKRPIKPNWWVPVSEHHEEIRPSQPVSDSSLLENHNSNGLLSRLLNKINTDVDIEVSGRRIGAHKRVLSSRCEYFARVLAGGYVESAGNIIFLPPFPYSVTHFTICYIYSGVSSIPENIDLLELASLADLLCLYDLKDVIAQTFEVKYCHNFHKLCPVCRERVLECLRLSYKYNMEELSVKCVEWITKYFHIVWRTENFGLLPQFLVDKCYKEHLTKFDINGFLDTLNGCAIVARGLQSGRWADNVFNLIRKLVTDIADLVALDLKKALEMIVVGIKNIQSGSIITIQECIANAIKTASLDQVCHSYRYLTEALDDISASRVGLWFKIIVKWQKLCESKLIRGSPKTVALESFKNLPEVMKIKLRELGCIDCPSLSVNLPRASKAITKTFDSSGPRPNLPQTTARPFIRAAVPPTVRMTRAQIQRMIYNQHMGIPVRSSPPPRVQPSYDRYSSRCYAENSSRTNATAAYKNKCSTTRASQHSAISQAMSKSFSGLNKLQQSSRSDLMTSSDRFATTTISKNSSGVNSTSSSTSQRPVTARALSQKNNHVKTSQQPCDSDLMASDRFAVITLSKTSTRHNSTSQRPVTSGTISERNGHFNTSQQSHGSDLLTTSDRFATITISKTNSQLNSTTSTSSPRLVMPDAMPQRNNHVNTSQKTNDSDLMTTSDRFATITIRKANSGLNSTSSSTSPGLFMPEAMPQRDDRVNTSQQPPGSNLMTTSDRPATITLSRSPTLILKSRSASTSQLPIRADATRSQSINNVNASQPSTSSISITSSDRFATGTRSKYTNKAYKPTSPLILKPGPTKIAIAKKYFIKEKPVETMLPQRRTNINMMKPGLRRNRK